MQANEHIVLLSAALARLGLVEIVVSPGSRSAPISLALARQSSFRIQTVLDERAAAYIALGKALQSSKPVALVCTSGTALLNFAPAVAEAFYQKIPLLVLSADRPQAWIDQGDGQSIHQNGVLQQHVLANMQLPESLHHADDQWFLLRSISELWAKAVSGGPVHLNIPLREPLYALPAPIDPKTVDLILNYQNQPTTPLPEALRNDWQNAKSIGLLPGFQSADAAIKTLVQDFAADERVVIFSEALSNTPGHFTQIDGLAEQKEVAWPDLIIVWGGAPLSKKLKQQLRAQKNSKFWRIDPHGQSLDVFQQLAKLWVADPAWALKQLAALPPQKSPYRKAMLSLSGQIEQKLQALWPLLPFSDLSVTRQLLNKLPAELQLHLSNSMAVRYMQYVMGDLAAFTSVHANRGTSGIDGCTSTALGMASGSDLPVVLISGELSFVYDLNAFSIEEIPDNLKIVVLHNGGGDIFRQINGPKTQPEREWLFATPRNVDVEALAKAWGLALFSTDNALSLPTEIDRWWSAKQAAVLVVYTKEEANQAAVNQFYQSIRAL